MEIPRNLDRFLEFYDLNGSHQGCPLKRRTPAQALRDALGREKLPPVDPKKDIAARKEVV